jgi:hypothetical protein
MKRDELPGVLDLQQEVKMVRQKGEPTDPDWVEALRSGKGPEDDLVQRPAGSEQETAVERPAGHFDQCALFWDEAESSAHTPDKT